MKKALVAIFLLAIAPVAWGEITSQLALPGNSVGDVQYNGRGIFKGTDYAVVSTTTGKFVVLTPPVGSTRTYESYCSSASHIGRILISSPSASGQWVYVCESSGNWVQQGGSGAGTPGGLNTQFQFNDGGVFNGAATVAYSTTTNTLSISSATTFSNVGTVTHTGVSTITYDTGVYVAHAGSMTLSGNRLVSQAAPTSSQVLQWNSSTNRWEPGTLSSGVSIYAATATASFPFGFSATTATFSQGVTGTTATFTGQLIGQGTQSNDDAPTGGIGQHISSSTAANTSFPTTGQFGDSISIVVSTGDFDLTGCLDATANAATVTRVAIFLSTTTGNTLGGAILGDNKIDLPIPVSGARNGGGCVSNYRVPSVLRNSTNRWYLKVFADYSAATPLYTARISARRAR